MSGAPIWLRIFEYFSVYIADFLSHLGKWIKLIKIEAEYEHFKKVEITQNTTSSPSFCNVYVIK